MIIFSPGPANLSERVRRSMQVDDIPHRGPEFAALQREVHAGLVELLGVGDDYAAVTFSGSGSTALDAVASASGRFGRVLVVSNGVYGERAAAMAADAGVTVDHLRLDWLSGIDPALVDDHLRRHPADVLFVVHHETTTGRLNPLEAIARLGRSHGALVVADTISSIAGEPLDVGGWGVDIAIGTACKCIRGVPGVSFVVARRSLLDAVAAAPRARYADLATHWLAQEAGSTPFTPALPAFFALREALAELREEGVDARRASIRANAARLEAGLRRLGIDALLPASERAASMLACRLPQESSFGRLDEHLRLRGIAIYGAQAHLAATTFRLGLVGWLRPSDIGALLTGLADAPGVAAAPVPGDAGYSTHSAGNRPGSAHRSTTGCQ